MSEALTELGYLDFTKSSYLFSANIQEKRERRGGGGGNRRETYTLNSV